MDQKQQGSLIAGIVVLALAAVFHSTFTDSDPQTPNEPVNTATCAMTAAAVPLFVAAVTSGRSAAVIDGIGGVITATACKATLEQLQKAPTTPVLLEVQTPEQTASGSVTLPDLTTRPPQPSTRLVPMSTMLQCLQSYDSQTESLLLKWCYDGVIQPRS